MTTRALWYSCRPHSDRATRRFRLVGLGRKSLKSRYARRNASTGSRLQSWDPTFGPTLRARKNTCVCACANQNKMASGGPHHNQHFRRKPHPRAIKNSRVSWANSATPQWGTEKCPERKIPNQKTSEIRVPISAFDYRLCLWNLSTEVSMKFEVWSSAPTAPRIFLAICP